MAYAKYFILSRNTNEISVYIVTQHIPKDTYTITHIRFNEYTYDE